MSLPRESEISQKITRPTPTDRISEGVRTSARPFLGTRFEGAEFRVLWDIRLIGVWRAISLNLRTREAETKRLL